MLSTNKITPKQLPVISVVVPAYNEERLIKRCLANLRNQDFELPYEIIVVNGPSSDQTKSIAKKFADVVIDQIGIGIGQARNQGCLMAKAKIIAITDADVFVPPNWLSQIYKFFKKHKNIIAITGPYRFTNSNYLNKKLYIRDIAFEFHKNLTGTVALSGTNMAIRKNAYNKAGGFDPKITGLEDVELGMRLNKIGKCVYLKDFFVETTDRRFKNPTKHILGTLLPAYVKRVIFKSKDEKIIWKPVKN